MGIKSFIILFGYVLNCIKVRNTTLMFPFNSDSSRNILAKNIVAHIFASKIIQQIKECSSDVCLTIFFSIQLLLLVTIVSPGIIKAGI